MNGRAAFAGWVVAVCVVACSADVSLDANATVIVNCASDGDCPGQLRCSQSAGACIAADDPDASPELLQVAAIDATHVVATFSKRLAVNAGESSRYSIAGLGALGAELSSDGVSVTLVTTPQRARGYTFVCSGITDTLRRALLNPTATFVGIGTPLDDRAPVLVTPVDRERIAGLSLLLSWAPNEDATRYTVELAWDEAFADAVPGFPIEVDAPAASRSITVPTAAIYYWRVRADTTRAATLAVQRFAALGDSVDVYCPELDACAASADPLTWLSGTAKSPLKRVADAIRIARTLDLHRIRVARRSETVALAYADGIVISGARLQVEGGYNGSFSARDVSRPSLFASTFGPCRVVNTLEPVTLEGLACRGAGGGTESSLYIAGSRAPVVVSDCVSDLVVIRSAEVSLRSVQAMLPMPGVNEITDSTVDVANSMFLSAGFDVARSTFALEDSVVEAISARTGPCASTRTLTLQDSDVHIERSVVRIPLDSEPIVHTTVALAGGNLHIGATLIGSAEPRFIASGDDCAPESGHADVNGVSVGAAGALHVENSTIVAHTSAIKDQVSGSEGASVVVLHSALESAAESVIQLRAASLELVNSVVACSGPGLTGASMESASALESIVANAFVGCANLVSTDIPSIVYASPSAIDAAPELFDTRRASNLAFADYDADFPDAPGNDGMLATFDAVWRPDASSPAATQGYDLNGASCGSLSAPYPCAQLTTDIAGAPRVAPVSIGPFEVNR